MTEKDLLITPIWFILLSVGAYLIRPYVTDENTRRYFMPALMIRFVAAILLGVLYQFYYGGGDTLNFHVHGSQHIFEVFKESFFRGVQMLISPAGEPVAGTYEYASQIWYFRDPNSYFIVKITAFFDLFTFGTYSATALFFATFSFSGLWALYQLFYKQYNNLHLKLAIAILFVPSVIFWGSGILKDTVTLGAIGWLTWFFYRIFIKGKITPLNIIGLLGMFGLLYGIKIYIVLSFIPALMLWAVMRCFKYIKSLALKLVIVPILIFIAGLIAINLMEAVALENPKYAISNIAETARITAYDIRYGWGARGGGEGGYDLGLLDGTWQSMVRLAPAAINVSLFRPYLWEVRNPLMLIAALESTLLLFFTLFVVIQFFTGKVILNNQVIFCLSFALIFSFAVGISTYNFGTLMRYKIPMMPFYLTALVIIAYSKRERKRSLLASTEYELTTV